MGSPPADLREADIAAGPDRIRTTWFGLYGAAGVDIMALHGIGAAANRFGARFLLERLAARSVSGASFNFPGHGDSPGDAAGATLTDRLRQAGAMAAALKPKVLYGVSMGAFAAVRLAATVRPSALVMLCRRPARRPSPSSSP